MRILSVEPSSPRAKGYMGSFNGGKLRDKLSTLEVCPTVAEANVLIEQRRREHNQLRLHSVRNCRPPGPQGIPTVIVTQQAVSLNRGRSPDIRRQRDTTQIWSPGRWRGTGKADPKRSVYVPRCILLHPGSLFVHNHFVLSRGHKHIFSTVFENFQTVRKF